MPCYSLEFFTLPDTELKTHIFTADRIHDGERFLPQGSAVVFAADGTVLDVLAESPADAERLDGVLCPGFVNAHCHLELSHMQGAIPEGTGLPGFLVAVMQQRSAPDEVRTAARYKAADELRRNGVVAVGDIVNSVDTADIRAVAPLHLHDFVECMGFVPAGAGARLAAGKSVLAQLADAPALAGYHRAQSLTAHATYSVSRPLLEMVAADSARLSIHVNESAEEQEFFRASRGGFLQVFQSIGVDVGFYAGHDGTLAAQLAGLPADRDLLLVHNTHATPADLQWAAGRAGGTWFCLCPSANLYIEQRLPDLARFLPYPDRICLGTDSLASNHQLSILHEAATLRRSFPDGLDWEVLLRWACANGADALGMSGVVGRLRVGMKPGLVSIAGLDDAAAAPRASVVIAA